MSMTDEERRARMQISRVAEPGDPDACQLVREHTAAALIDRLRAGGGASRPKANAWAERLAAADVDVIQRLAARVAARFIVPGDAEWPDGLADLRQLESVAADRRGGEPFGLWVRGPLSLAGATQASVAIVGARACSEYGEHVAGSLAAGCSSRGWTVVSGGAYGIDAAAHRGAIAAARPTVAVLASGIDRLYPAGNGGMLEKIAESGLIVSEAAPGCSPSRSRFLVRNRLIAALSGGAVVVEAALRSGSLNTARWARDIARPVMGVPGPITSMMSAGVHELLRQPESVLVTDTDEILELVSPIGSSPAPVKQGPVAARDLLDEVDRRLLEAVPKVLASPAGSIATIAQMSPSEALGRLSRLTRDGLVVRVDNGWRLPPDGPDAP